jgi:hypothetical protein
MILDVELKSEKRHHFRKVFQLEQAAGMNIISQEKI